MEKARLVIAEDHFQSWVVRRERIWRQKASSYGLSMKDYNTKFFHASIVIRRKRNEIVHLEINENNFHGMTNIKREIRNYFVKRFSQEQVLANDFSMNNTIQEFQRSNQDFLNRFL